jgi:hypothetical protein
VLNGKCSDDCRSAVERACDYCRPVDLHVTVPFCVCLGERKHEASERVQRALEVVMLRGLPSH